MRVTDPVRRLLVLAAMLSAGCDTRPAEYGVSVFATDTIPVAFTVTLTGSLELGLRAEGLRMLPDKSLLLATPAELMVHKGDGTARIVALSNGRLAVQPLGISADSGDTATVEGRVVLLVKPPERRLVKLTAEKP